MALIPACAMGAGVSKSGSPAPKPMTSFPSSLRRAARAVTARVGEGLTRWTRRERDKVADSFSPLKVASSRYIKRLRPRRPFWGLRGAPDQPRLHSSTVPVMEQTEHHPFELVADYTASGDQPQAIEKLVEGLNEGLAHQTMLGVTGSGKSVGYEDPILIAEVVAGETRTRLVQAGPFIDA